MLARTDRARTALQRLVRGHARTLSVALSLALTATSCKSDEEQTIELVEEMATLFEKHQADCDVLGTRFEAFASDNTSRFVALRRLGRLEGDTKKAFEKKYGKRLDAAMRKLMDGATACMSNPKVADALKKIR